MGSDYPPFVEVAGDRLEGHSVDKVLIIVGRGPTSKSA